MCIIRENFYIFANNPLETGITDEVNREPLYNPTPSVDGKILRTLTWTMPITIITIFCIASTICNRFNVWHRKMIKFGK